MYCHYTQYRWRRTALLLNFSWFFIENSGGIRLALALIVRWSIIYSGYERFMGFLGFETRSTLSWERFLSLCTACKITSETCMSKSKPYRYMWQSPIGRGRWGYTIGTHAWCTYLSYTLMRAAHEHVLLPSRFHRHC